MSFLWENYFQNEETEIVNPSDIKVDAIYKALNKIKGIKNIDIYCRTYHHMDDGRKKAEISIDLKKGTDLSKVLSSVVEALESGYEVKIEELSDREEENKKNGYSTFKRMRLRVCKKFGTEESKISIGGVSKLIVYL